jgi:hypothetical protein
MSETVPVPIPRATYRLQFHKGFGFRDAAALAPYLAQVGISHVYASPYLKARPGSTHGYDIVNHGRLNPELGDEMAFRDMVMAFRANGLAQIMDSCQTIWVSVAPTIRDGSMCWNGAQTRTTRAGSTSIGTRTSTTCAASSWYHSLAINMGRCWRRDSLSCGSSRRRAAGPSGLTGRTSCTALPARTRRRAPGTRAVG